jgi:NAD(P)H dehydrogenase (quinone)
MPTVAVVYYSAQGHTHALAEAVAEGARGVSGTTVVVHRLQDADIQNGRWKNDATITALNAADAIIFGTPTYMGGYSAQMKAFLDACGGIWYQQGWKDKLAAGFTHSGGLSGDKLNTLQGLVINAMQHSMLWIGPGLMVEGPAAENVNRLSSFTGAMAQSYPDGTPVSDGDKKTAAGLGKRVAEAAARWVKK